MADIDHTQFPNGLSRANGAGGKPGTPDASGQIRYYRGGQEVDKSEVELEEAPESPEIERAEKCTINTRAKTTWDDATTRLLTMGRGTLMEDEFRNQSVILSAKITHQPGDMAEIAVVAEGRFIDPPPDEFSLEAVELGVNIMKHPRYLFALEGDTDDEYILNQSVIRELQIYFENANYNTRDSIIYRMFGSLGHPGEVQAGVPVCVDDDVMAKDWNGKPGPISPITGTDMCKRAAIEIIQKFWRGEDTPYLVGLEMTWSSWYFIPPYINLGGYVEDPIYDAYPQVPANFISVVEPPDLNAQIFDAITLFNPQCYARNGIQGGPLEISWLRKSDRIEKQNYVYKVTRRWWGAPIGYWDPELNTTFDRPAFPNDYVLATMGRLPPLPAKAR